MEGLNILSKAAWELQNAKLFEKVTRFILQEVDCQNIWRTQSNSLRGKLSLKPTDIKIETTDCCRHA